MKIFNSTPIEILMLVVIFGVLGVTIYISKDPLEQINRAEDISLESDASSLSSALKEYYKKERKYPWGIWNFEKEFLVASEDALKLRNLADPRSLQRLLIVPYSAKNAVTVCFEPKSEEFKRLASKDCVKVEGSDCLFCSK